jgi:uncharacterized protein DUF6941
MELDYAILADKADRTYDGKLVVVGGDIDSLITTELPAAAQVYVVARLLLQPGEPVEGHTFSIEAESPSGTRTVVADNQPLTTTRNPEEPDQPSAARLILNLTIGLKSEGPHFIYLKVDGKQVKAFRFRVKHVPEQQEQ